MMTKGIGDFANSNLTFRIKKNIQNTALGALFVSVMIPALSAYPVQKRSSHSHMCQQAMVTIDVMEIAPIEEVVKPIRHAVTRAIHQANHFKVKYTEGTTGHEYDRMAEETDHMSLHGLPKRTVKDEVDEDKSIDDFIIDAFHDLQHYSLYLEEYIEDTCVPNKSYMDEFSETQSNIHQILCTMYDGILARNVKPRSPPRKTTNNCDDIANGQYETESERERKGFHFLKHYIHYLQYVKRWIDHD